MSRFYFQKALVVTHIAYRKDSPSISIEGPYSFLCQSLTHLIDEVNIFGLPLNGYENDIKLGNWNGNARIKLPGFFGKWLPLKFAVDVLLESIYVILWSIKSLNKKKLVIGIDPLSCLPLLLFKNIFGYTLVFHCVDFNKSRFSNSILQRFYELADKWASRYSDETWVVCESLKRYKKNNYGVKSHYLPNSVSFDELIFSKGSKFRTGNKMVWTGSLMTTRQFEILFGILSKIQTSIKRDISYVLAPTRDHEKFKKFAKKYKVKRIKILKLNSRKEFQKIASRCDLGIALYDEQFGSTEFIEPMKMWDFLLCGLPFIVSKEPSISRPVRDGGVAYFLGPKNTIENSSELKKFLSKRNLILKSKLCLGIAKNFDIDKQVKTRVRMLSSSISRK